MIRLVDGLQLFARLEANSFSGRDAHFGAGAWIAANSGLSRTYVEDAEAAQLDAVALRERALHTFKIGFNGLLGFSLSDAGFVHNFIDDVELDHAIGSRAEVKILAPGLPASLNSAAQGKRTKGTQTGW
jgi:hypothetical protein